VSGVTQALVRLAVVLLSWGKSFCSIELRAMTRVARRKKQVCRHYGDKSHPGETCFSSIIRYGYAAYRCVDPPRKDYDGDNGA
jgi:hypothetical protein